jgi:hypothetical protein
MYGLPAGCLLAATPLWPQNLINVTCPSQTASGSSILCPIALSLGMSVKVDNLTFALNVTPNGTALPLTTGQLKFSEFVIGSFKGTGGTNNSMVMVWESLSPALSGRTAMGLLSFISPASAASGQTYSVNITGASASVGNNIVDLSIGPASTVLIIGPILTLGPASLSFTAVQGGANPANQTIDVSNTGGGPLNWSAAVTGGSFLTLGGTATGTTPATITGVANVGSLTASTYNGNIQVTTADGRSIDIPVTLVVTSPTRFAQVGAKLVGSGAGGLAAPGRSVALSADGNTASVGWPSSWINGRFRCAVSDQEALGVLPVVHDLNHDGVVTVANVQKMINAVLGRGCPF